MIQIKKRFKITCSRKPAVTLVIWSRGSPENHVCHICRQEQGLIGKSNCMTVKALQANEPVAKIVGKATKGRPYHREVESVNEEKPKKQGRFGKRSQKSKVRYAHV